MTKTNKTHIVNRINMALTQEQKQLLLKDLCARLPYGVFVVNTVGGRNIRGYLSQVDTMYKCILVDTDLVSHNGEKREFSPIEHIKPYLRPMSSMTEEEKEDYNSKFEGRDFSWEIYYGSTDWLNAHYFDYRCLIEKGFALEAPENMYEF